MAMSVRAMAAALNVSKSQVARDASSGMPMGSAEAALAWRRANHDLSRTAHGRIDRAPAGAGVHQAPESAGLDKPPAKPAASAPIDDDDQAAEDADTAAFRKARAQREQIRCQREQVEFDELLGKLIPLADAQRIASTSFRSLRDAVLNVPARLKDQLAATSDPMAIERIIDDELSAAFKRFDETAMLVDETLDDDDEAG